MSGALVLAAMLVFPRPAEAHGENLGNLWLVFPVFGSWILLFLVAISAAIYWRVPRSAKLIMLGVLLVSALVSPVVVLAVGDSGGGLDHLASPLGLGVLVVVMTGLSLALPAGVYFRLLRPRLQKRQEGAPGLAQRRGTPR